MDKHTRYDTNKNASIIKVALLPLVTHPDVDLWPLVLLALEDLRGRVGRASAPRVEVALGLEVVGEAEVRDLDVHVGVEQEVLGLQVPVDDPAGVAVLHRVDDLPELASGQRLGHPAVTGDVFWGEKEMLLCNEL